MHGLYEVRLDHEQQLLLHANMHRISAHRVLSENEITFHGLESEEHLALVSLRQHKFAA